MSVELSVPLCVDLDGTFINTDSLHESFLELLRRDPGEALEAFSTLKLGKAAFKAKVSESTALDLNTIPVNQAVLDFLYEQKSAGRTLVLVTGASAKIASQFKEHFDLFDDVMSSNETVNLTGNAKRDALVSQFGDGRFDYIGNDRVDWSVWDSARKVYVVSPQGNFLKQTQNKYIVEKVFITPRPSGADWLRLLRLHQWAKNLLIFVPIGLDHGFGNLHDFIILIGCFFAFSLLASLTYIINDLLDLKSDRLNSTKSKRSLAKGSISIKQGLRVILVLLVCVLLLVSVLPRDFNLILCVYLLTTLSYTLWWKKYVYLDVCVLAALHSMRILAGTVAIQLEWSFWLVCFSLFMFMSLALAKRVAELLNLQKTDRFKSIGRGYAVSDIQILTTSGLSSAHLSVLVVALYINSDKVQQNYQTPEVLWSICPLLLYWTGRVWLITSRGEMHEDPIVFALKDGTSRLTFILCVLMVLIATFWGGLYG